MKNYPGILFLCLYILSLACGAAADDLSDVNTILQSSMNDVLKIAKETGTDDAQKRAELWDIVLKTFDFEKITEFTLGKFSSRSSSKLGDYENRRFSTEQHAEFQKLFTRHLGNTYLDRLQFDGSDVKIDVEPAIMLSPKKNMKRARVNTIINDKILIDYMMLKRDNVWKVYDLKVEGRSLVSAFRKEYKTVLIKNKPDYLIDLIKGKIAEHDAAKQKKAKKPSV